MTDRQHAWRDYFDSEYLVGEALPDEGRTYTIADKARVGIEDKGETKHKLVLTMTDGTKWLTNVTNCTYLERMFEEKEPVAWVGKRVTLQFDPNVKFGKDVVGGIRVIGSPDIIAPVSFTFAANSRQKPRQVTLKPTGNAPHAAENNVEADSGDSGAESDAGAADGTIPGRGAKSAQGQRA